MNNPVFAISRPTKIIRARELRDHLVPLIGTYGRDETVAGRAARTWRHRGLVCMLTMPPEGEGRFWLDVWLAKKVLSVRWTAQDDFEMLSFKPGPWEADAFALSGPEDR